MVGLGASLLTFFDADRPDPQRFFFGKNWAPVSPVIQIALRVLNMKFQEF